MFDNVIRLLNAEIKRAYLSYQEEVAEKKMYEEGHLSIPLYSQDRIDDYSNFINELVSAVDVLQEYEKNEKV